MWRPARSSIVTSGRCSYIFSQSTAAINWLYRPRTKCSQHSDMGEGTPVGVSTKGSEGATRTTIAFRCGGCCRAASHWITPGYELPIVPTLPSDQDCSAHHPI